MRDAIGDRLDELRERQTRVSFIFSTSFGHLLDASREEAMSTWAKDCLFDLGFDANPIVVGSGCSSSADGIAVAAAMLVDGAADVAVVVAVDIVTRTKRVAHSKLGTMTDELPRPFDLQRNGMLLGEAATAIILRRSCPGETSEGELVGIGSSNDAYSLTAPDPTGFAGRLAIERALGSAKLISQDIGVYYAHGTGTVLNDALEASIIADLFADNPSLVVVGTKGALGHSLGACGALEFVLLLRMLRDQKVPATVGTARAMETISNRLAQISPEKRELRYGLTMTLGFGGFNTALIARAMPCPSGNAPEAVGPGRAK
ncbi:beta-ketoacyl synthase N-terminal-like domain-containing protein [Agrobacterium tumefaciens]|uniref:beta-ketoacyl synthase N-terminal-like domain-containing protein n=1 Tax=Agrobacterium tumefaciens TaxID=358 RepID=UPI001AECBBF4